MRKKLLIVILFVFILSATGCGQQGAINDSEQEQADASVPEWLESYSEFKNSSTSIYIDSSEEQLSIKEDHIVIPEGNIILVTKEIAGQARKEAGTDQKQIQKIMQLLQETKVLKEEEVPEIETGHWLGLDFDMVFLSAQGDYSLVKVTVRDDHVAAVDILDENGEDEISAYIQSEELVTAILDAAEFRELDPQKFAEVTDIQIIDAGGQAYECPDEEMTQIKGILNGNYKKTDRCQGPFDVYIQLTFQDGEKAEARWCNDGCGILAVEGHYYKFSGKD